MLVKCFFSIFFCISFQARASLRMDVDGEIAQGFFSGNFGLSQYFAQESDQLSFSQWSATIGANQSKYQDSGTGVVTTTKGRSGSLGTGIVFDRKWNLDASLFANSTPDTRFGESGGFIQASYIYRDREVSDFGFALGVGAGKSKVNQKISFQIVNTLVNRDVEIDKNESSFFLSLYPNFWLSIRMDYQKYSYSRSKQDLQAAYASRFLNYYTTDLISSIGGLPESAYSISGTVSLNDDWDLSGLYRNTHLIVDDSDSRKIQLYLDHYFEKWTGGMGISQSETAQSKENSLLARISFDL